MSRTYSPYYRLLTALFLSLMLTACAGSRTHESTGEYVEDSALTAKVKTALLADPAVSGLAINVETFKGTVQLSGFATSEAERERAQAVAQAVSGVASVKNDIRLK